MLLLITLKDIKLGFLRYILTSSGDLHLVMLGRRLVLDSICLHGLFTSFRWSNPPSLQKYFQLEQKFSLFGTSRIFKWLLALVPLNSQPDFRLYSTLKSHFSSMNSSLINLWMARRFDGLQRGKNKESLLQTGGDENGIHWFFFLPPRGLICSESRHISSSSTNSLKWSKNEMMRSFFLYVYVLKNRHYQ